MATLCRSLGLLFIMAPHTGCSAVRQLLKKEFGGERLPEKPVLNRRGKIILRWKHNTLQQLTTHRILSHDDEKNLLKFTTVRNPFDALVTLYTKRSKMTDEFLRSKTMVWLTGNPKRMRDVRYCRTHTFVEWVRWRHRRRAMLSHLRIRSIGMYDAFTKGVDIVMRFETLEQDLNSVLRRVGVTDPVKIPVFNKTGGRERDYRGYYDAMSRRIVERAFRADLERYGYSF